ncbi:MAG: type II secretion system F family protein [Patescibacteria group bacterium]
MAVFQYKASDESGQRIEGIIEAPTEGVAASMLSDRGLIILSLKEGSARKGEIDLPFLNAIKIKDIVLFSRQVAVMASANVPIVQALRIIHDQTENERMQKIVGEIGDEVDGGAKLSQALARYPKIFSDFFISMIKSGETSGKLDETLNYLADQQEKDYDMQAKIKGAMIYPAFIVVGLVVVGFLMSIFVLPKLTSILTQSGQELPFTTQILVSISNYMSSYWWTVLIGIVALVAGFRFATGRTGPLKTQWDYLKIKLPVFGQLYKRIYIVRITRSLSTLIVGGVPLTTALQITADVVGNDVYEDVLRKTVKEVEDGRSIATLFLQSEDIPTMVSQMMQVGEQTGKLDQILDKLTVFYSRELENLVSNLVTLIEPLIMLVMGGAVGFVVISIILPLYNLSAGY